MSEMSPLPQHPFAPLHDERQLLGQKRYREAHTACRQIIEKNADTPDAYYVMGVISYEHHDFMRAMKLFEVAIEKGHPEPGPHVQLARCFTNLNMPKKALQSIDVARRLNPKDGYTLSSIGATLSRLDRHADAALFYRKASEVAPEDPSVFFNLGSTLQFMGDFDGAESAYLTALNLAPSYTQARVHLTLIRTQTPDKNDLEPLEIAWRERHPKDLEGGLNIAHAFAKVYGDLGDSAAMMTWLDRGKSLILPHIPNRQKKDLASYAAAKSLAKTLEYDIDTPAEGPIFIVGLPRSGTTLIDRILSSHSEMISAGERTEFAASFHEQLGGGGTDIVDANMLLKAPGTDMLAIGDLYRDRIEAILDGDERFTDKMPINVMFAPAILAAIPTARIVCLRRHPADSVLSIYRQLFELSAIHYRYAYDLESLANYVVAFNELVDVYVRALPSSRFTVMDYERLVDQPENEIRRLLAHCGLPFEQDCLDFQNNAAPVATASVAQVRKPIYKSAIGRWKQYQDHLEPALAILRQSGLLE